MSGPRPVGDVTPLEGDTFDFDCRPGVSCFGHCCADLNLMILPYDALRLRQRLELDSSTFLERYVDTSMDEETGLPKIRLRMGDDPQQSCPFVSDGACTVYEDRPGACRIFPLGRAVSTHPLMPGSRQDPGGPAERFFLVREPVCHGFQESPRSWSVTDWLADQGMEPYLAQNDAWLPIFGRLSTIAQGPHAAAKQSMFLTAGYNLDRFRDLVLGDAFTARFVIEPDELERLGADDLALLSFGVRWLSFSLFGDPTMELSGEFTPA